MGYRHYFYSVPKTEIEEIKQIKTNDEFCNWAENKGYDVERYKDEEPYCAVYKLGKELYCFGKYVDWAFEMHEANESLFKSEELKEAYSDYCVVICTQEDFLTAINAYKKNIIDYYEGLLSEDKTSRFTIEERQKRHIENQLNEWKNDFDFLPINVDLSKTHIVNSWLYEYAIFELVRIYKAFDWENDTLVLIGW